MTAKQFNIAVEAINKRMRILNDDMYQDEVTPEGEMRTWANICGGK